MAYRRRPGASRLSSTFVDEVRNPLPEPNSFSGDGGGDVVIGINSSAPSSLAAKAIRESSAHKDSSLSSAYGYSSISSASRDFNPNRSSSPSVKDPNQYEYTSIKSINESKQGLWSSLARKAKSILDDDNVSRQSEAPGRTRMQMHDTTTGVQYHSPYYSRESGEKLDSPKFQKGLGAITSSLNYIGGTIGNAVEEGLTIVENKTADIIQETRKHIIKKSSGSEAQNQATTHSSTLQQPQMQLQTQTDQEIQLKASRDVAMAMAAKAKLLLRELKTVKADLAFAKERCSQLEEENKIFRESHGRGNPEDDDLIRLQLETLLAEKSRLAHENSVYTRENRFLREIVEYHQLTMQDVVYLDENTEEITEVYPHSPFANTIPQVTPDISHSLSLPELAGIYQGTTLPSFYVPITVTDDTKVHTQPFI